MKKAVTLIVAVIAIDLFLVLVRISLKQKGLDGVFASLGHLGLVSVAAILVSRKFISRQSKQPFFRFRAIVITLGLFFGVMVSQLGTGLLQRKIFGDEPYKFSSGYHLSERQTSHASIEQSSPRVISAQSVGRAVIGTLAEVTTEEIVCRWLILEALLAIATPGAALLISSIIFSTFHAVVPIANGDPDVYLYLMVPTFLIGLWSGIAYLRYGLVAAITVHFMTNLLKAIATEDVMVAGYTAISLTIFALSVLPLTLWFTRRGPTPALTLK